MPTVSKPKLYNPRHPERTLLYQTVAEHYETWLDLASAGQFDEQGTTAPPSPMCASGYCPCPSACATSCSATGPCSSFSVDTSVRIEARDRAALERLLRNCARPPFSMERLRKAGSTLVYRCAKQHSEPGGDRRGPRANELTLTSLELIERIAALVPPPRTHRHRYYGVLAPNSQLRAAVASMAQAVPLQPAKVPPEPATASDGVQTQSEPAPFRCAKAHYLWAALIARIYEVFPL